MCLTLQSILHVVLSSYAHAEENVILLVAKGISTAALWCNNFAPDMIRVSRVFECTGI